MFDVGDGSYQEVWLICCPVLHCAHSHCMSWFVCLPAEYQADEIAALFQSAIDLWGDARMEEVVQYLKACPMLALPASWPADF